MGKAVGAEFPPTRATCARSCPGAGRGAARSGAKRRATGTRAATGAYVTLRNFRGVRPRERLSGRGNRTARAAHASVVVVIAPNAIYLLITRIWRWTIADRFSINVLNIQFKGIQYHCHLISFQNFYYILRANNIKQNTTLLIVCDIYRFLFNCYKFNKEFFLLK